MHRQSKLLKITLAAMFAALIFIATAFLMIPLPGSGYAHLGDCFILVAALALGPVYGALAAAVGSALADLFLGFGVYAPATFVVKALVALTAALLYKAFKKARPKGGALWVAGAAFVAELVMVLGYFLFESGLYGAAASAVNIPGNALQGLSGLVLGTALYGMLEKTGVLSKL